MYSVAEARLEDARVAERQAKAARLRLANAYPGVDVHMEVEYVAARNPGSGVLCTAHCENMVLGSDAPGEKGVRSETVGRDAADVLIEDLGKNGVDRYAADQLLPFAALHGGKIRIPGETRHVETAIPVIHAFLSTSVEKMGGVLRFTA